MSEEQAQEQPVSEEAVNPGVQETTSDNHSEREEEKMVPLKALQAEKRKRQEAEYQVNWFKEQSTHSGQRQEEADDSDELLTKGELKKLSAAQQQQIKREVLEESFLASNPDALNRINDELPEILEKRPFLASAIQSAHNRYAAAWQILQDYKRAPESAVKQKIKENESKPGSPVGVGRSGQLSKSEMLEKMSATEFREYRKKMLAKR